MTEIIAKTRYAQSAPRKLRAVAKLVKRKPATQALITLQFTPKKAARILAKTIRSALYNGVNNFNFDKEELNIKSITIDQGPTLKRFIAMARGSANTYCKRTSHITVILETPSVFKPKEEPIAPAEESATTVSTPPKTAKKTAKKAPAKPRGAKTTVAVRSRRAKKS